MTLSTSQESPPAVQPQDNPTSTVLVVDDDPLVCDTLVRYLQHEGHQVVATQDGAEALGLVHEHGIDLVMLDVRMPGLSGLEVLEKLRGRYSSASLPVLMMTGFGDRQGALEAFDLGADDYVSKPIDFPVVAARIQTRLRLRLAETQDLALPSAQGEILDGRYQLGRIIGRGQFGVVYQAHRLADGMALAIKLLRRDLDTSQETVERFHLEVETLRRIQHPHAVTVLELGIAQGGHPFLVMELLEGRSLAEELQETAPLAPVRCGEILPPICAVLAEVHDKGIVHRDIKPQNIFLHREPCGREMVKVLDFGIAKLLDDLEGGVDLTSDGIGPGTPTYMAPERYHETPYDGAADIYSLGVTLHEMLCGRPPFDTSQANPLRVALKHMSEAPPPLRSLMPHLSGSLEALVLSMLSKSPGERPTARQLLAQLPSLLSDAEPPEDRGLPSSTQETSNSLISTLGNLLRRFSRKSRTIRQVFVG